MNEGARLLTRRGIREVLSRGKTIFFNLGTGDDKKICGRKEGASQSAEKKEKIFDLLESY